MYKQKDETVSADQLWRDFVTEEQLTTQQEQLFRKYTDLLLDWNKKTNITRITDLADIIHYHYQDALHLDRFADVRSIRTLCDIGTGGGIPGIPLKIKYPHLRILLIEVNGKKISFLRDVIDALELSDVEIIDLDWRTFLRSYKEPIDFFVARASLPVAELARALTLGTPYHDSTIVYWASMYWEPTKQEKKYVQRDEMYTLADKKRRYIFLNNEKRVSNQS